jgi:hypothetical protein
MSLPIGPQAVFSPAVTNLFIGSRENIFRAAQKAGTNPTGGGMLKKLALAPA